jgi:hypothetical protein
MARAWEGLICKVWSRDLGLRPTSEAHRLGFLGDLVQPKRTKAGHSSMQINVANQHAARLLVPWSPAIVACSLCAPVLLPCSRFESQRVCDSRGAF